MKFALRAAAAAALLAAAGTAFAGLSVSSAIPSGAVLFSDNSAEQWIDEDGSGDLSVGDRLRGILSIGTIEQGSLATQIGGQSSYNELTGIFDTVVLTRTFQAIDVAKGNLYDFTFGASGALTSFGVSASTVGIFFEDSNNDYAREGCASYAACETTATGGSIWAAFAVGLWTADNAAGIPSVGSILPLTTPIGTFGVGLNFTLNNTGFDWNKVQCADATNPLIEVAVDFCGQGGILASGRDRVDGPDTPYEIFDNIDFTANRVPEPGAMGLVGLALAGVGFVTRRRKA